MDTLTHNVLESDVETEMTALTSEDITEESLSGRDEEELLQNRYMFNCVTCWVGDTYTDYQWCYLLE